MSIAVFLDRDGTLNEEVGYISNLEELKLIPGAAEAISKLNDAKIYAILTTNQSGPARGYYDEAHVQDLNNRLITLLKAESGAWLDAVYYCPHLPDGVNTDYAQDCSCRKPEPGMIQEALKNFPDIVLEKSYVIGDKATDIEFAVNSGCKGILLRTGYGEKVLQGDYQELNVRPHLICRDIVEAVNRILTEVNA